MSVRSLRLLGSVLFPACVGGCATTSPGVVETAPASAGAMACASEILGDRGYDVEVTGRAELHAEARVGRAGQGGVREIITAALDRSITPADLTIATRAWEYQPAQHGLPVARQSASEVRPSDEAVAAVRSVLAMCTDNS